jgi:hypothetical protein
MTEVTFTVLAWGTAADQTVVDMRNASTVWYMNFQTPAVIGDRAPSGGILYQAQANFVAPTLTPRTAWQTIGNPSATTYSSYGFTGNGAAPGVNGMALVYANSDLPPRSATLLFGRASDTLGATAAYVTLTDQDGFPIPNATPTTPAPVEQDGWLVSPPSGADPENVIVIQAPGGVGTTVLWVQLELSTGSGVRIGNLAALGAGAQPAYVLNACMLNQTTTPPPACFGPLTFVWCVADDGREEARRIHTVDSTTVFAVMRPDGTRTASRAEVFRHDTAVVRLATLCRGVHVTGDHLVLLRRGRRAGLLKAVPEWSCDACRAAREYGCPARCAAVAVEGYESLLAKDSTAPLRACLDPVYHVRLPDPALALVVGEDPGEDVLAEGYRSPATALTDTGTWTRV